MRCFLKYNLINFNCVFANASIFSWSLSKKYNKIMTLGFETFHKGSFSYRDLFGQLFFENYSLFICWIQHMQIQQINDEKIIFINFLAIMFGFEAYYAEIIVLSGNMGANAIKIIII